MNVTQQAITHLPSPLPIKPSHTQINVRIMSQKYFWLTSGLQGTVRQMWHWNDPHTKSQVHKLHIPQMSIGVNTVQHETLKAVAETVQMKKQKDYVGVPRENNKSLIIYFSVFWKHWKIKLKIMQLTPYEALLESEGQLLPVTLVGVYRVPP